MKAWKLLLIILLLFQVKTTLLGQEIFGKVVSIKDGDTIEILVGDTTTIRIRLLNIDCPEKNQDYGQLAKKFTSEKCFNTIVTIKGTKYDKYNRLLGTVILSNGENLNELLLSNGLAWHYKKYSTDSRLAEIENQARNNKVGLWEKSDAVAPWYFRHNR